MTEDKQSSPDASQAVKATGAGPSTAAVGEGTQPAQPVTAAPAPDRASAGPFERRIYQAGGGRKFLFSMVFLLLLPFYVSLPAMIYERLAAQLWLDAGGVVILAVAFSVVMLLVLFELIYSVRARIELGQQGIRFKLPAARGGAIPKLFYRKREIPYASIAAVETRREVYGGSMAPVLLQGVRLITHDDEKIALGYVNEANTDGIFPLPEIAGEIARRAGVEISHRGNVRREFRRKWLGLKALEDAGSAVPEADIAALNLRHRWNVLFVCSFLGALLLAGLVQDLVTRNIDRGERSADVTQTEGKLTPQAQKAKSQAAQKKN